jgi:hypothetical protein
MDSRLCGNDISCLQRYFILSFLHLNKSGVNSNSNLKTGCLRLRRHDISCLQSFFNLSFLRKQESSFCFSNPQSATGNRQRIYPPLPAG